MITVMSRLYRDAFWEDLKDFGKPQPGDQIAVTLKTGEDVVFDVTKDATGKLFFVTNDCLRERCVMGYGDNRHGWRDTEMRRRLNEDVFQMLPDELQAMIVPTKIVQVINNVRYECEDKLFCLSGTQVFGTNHSESDVWREREPEDSPLDIFTCNKDRIKMQGKSGSVNSWWLRSPYSIGSPHFSLVNKGGSRDCNGGSCQYGVCFGFCIES